MLFWLNTFVSEQLLMFPRRPDKRYYSFGLWADWLVMADIWLDNGVTRRQMEQRYGYSSQAAQDKLEKWMDRIT